MTKKELEKLLQALKIKSANQAPYFDARLLTKIEQIKETIKNY